MDGCLLLMMIIPISARNKLRKALDRRLRRGSMGPLDTSLDLQLGLG
jgi:hypothetical protein